MVEKINRIKDYLNNYSATSLFTFLKRRVIVKLLPELFLAAVLVFAGKSEAYPTIISDDETETLLHDIIRPIYQIAGIPFDAGKIYLINDNSLNAFVTSGNYLFIHTGTIMNIDNANQFTGIVAHEAGHIAGGHIVRQKLRISQMENLAAISLLAASAAAAASGRADTAIAVVLGSQSSLLNSLASYQMAEERSADESAVQYLSQLGQSAQGLKETIKKIQANNLLNGYDDTPYIRTHPVNTERLAFFAGQQAKMPVQNETQNDKKFKHIKAKLSAFLLPIKRGWQMYPKTKTDDSSQYAHAILHYRENNLPQALEKLNGLIARQPDNPYYHELKGQFLLESGKSKAALNAYSEALRLHPTSADIMLSWAQAALEAGSNSAGTKKIINILNQSLIQKSTPTGWLLLSRAYQENGQKAETLYAAAQYNASIGNIPTAYRQISQAEKQTPSPQLKLKLKDLSKQLKKNTN